MTCKEYFGKYRQHPLMGYIWYFLMILSFVNTGLFLFLGDYHKALTEFLIGIFILRINMLEQHISVCNEERDAQIPTDGFGK